MIILYLVISTYLFLIFGMTIGPRAPDLLLILLFFISYNKSLDFAMVAGFLLGLMGDLLYPSHLGIYTLVYTLLPGAIQFLKVRLYQNAISIMLIFLIIFVVKTLVIGLATNNLKMFLGWTILYTLIFFLPLFLVLNRILLGAWMRKL